MKKSFVLDTNVLIHDPEAVLHFVDNDVVLPITVIEELDKLKRGNGEIPFSARQALRLIDSFRELGKLSSGVKLPGGGCLWVKIEEEMHLPRPSNDNRIISTAVSLANDKDGQKPVILVSKDTSVRIKADSLGLVTQDYLKDKTTVFQKYGNLIEDEAVLNDIRSVRYLKSGDKIFRAYGENNMELIRRQRQIMNISPKNIEQECAIDALLSPQINVIALTGRAGTGKTLLAIAAGLYFCMKPKSQYKGHQEQSRKYEQVVVARPIVPLGNDLGFLPGDVKEKLHPWMQPIYDNLDVIVGTPDDREGDKNTDYRSADYLVESDIVHIEPLTYIRGRSLPKRFLIIDEAQNLRPLDVKTIITRCGEGTKVIFTGDLEQIDSPFLDAASNGLSHLINKFIQEENFCYLNLKHGARSALAERAAELL
ncbi:MAG: PhoH family protein [Nitrospiraceae bacterium]|nr:MAG: PhoH family protein [Nitrospiraceae bacterium]